MNHALLLIGSFKLALSPGIFAKKYPYKHHQSLENQLSCPCLAGPAM